MDNFLFLYDLSTGFIKSYAIKTVLDLEIPKKLKNQPKTVQELSEECQVDERMLYVLLRTLSTFGIFKEDEEKDMLFHNSKISSHFAEDDDPLCAGVKFNLSFLPTYTNFEDTIKTGKPMGLKTLGVNSFFEYVNENPTFQKLFHSSMSVYTNYTIMGILKSIDFSKYKTIVDLGGSKGEFLKSILKQYPQNDEKNNIQKAINYDLKSAFVTINDEFMDPRFSNFEGDLFNEDLLPQSDCYLIKYVLHIFNDDQAFSILNKVAKSSSKDTKLYIFEHIIYKNKQSILIGGEITLLHLANGHERTISQWESLISKTNLKIDEIKSIPNQLGSYIVCSLK